ncbi:MAG: malto-oligosyltrehalose synthase [Deltaproteobacteria bacterium]|jgi:(1->4)-alpha-D-glucan 1-alpha-D-glucosylmutase|nr:malto-oligosyltrehalose synthase [Deltaproteobacteria bacterium]
MNRDFTFRKAAALLDYLKQLGISHCYVSPLLKARPGSHHCYDIIDHSSINPEMGGLEDFEYFLARLEELQMALVLDIVPNHMGVGSDNEWWMDVLENGESSLYASFFDINWQPQSEELQGRVLLPILGGHYGQVLGNGELALLFDTKVGSFFLTYYDHMLPIAPETYPFILGRGLQRLEDLLGKQHSGYLELQNIISSFANLPSRRHPSADSIILRHRSKEGSKRLLARLCCEIDEINQFVQENVILFNGETGIDKSFDLLHDLLEQQPYRLAFWRVASDEINYRRFFDINDLAGLKMEEIEVFKATHALVLDLVATGKIDGLRIDHPDGLYDPCQYFRRLQRAAAGALFVMIEEPPHGRQDGNLPLYVVAEKILADFENLSDCWEIYGTTGYDFSNLVNGIFVDPAGEKPLTETYHNFIGQHPDFDEIVRHCKKLIMKSAMAGELNVLATRLYNLAKTNRFSQDFTLNRLREALAEVIACFPVYRTYIVSRNITKDDTNFIEWAVSNAREQERIEDVSIFDFIRSVLLLEQKSDNHSSDHYLDFVMKFQQYTGPVMAKGLEDTAFYMYNRLLSLNEVGGEPKRFGVSLQAFHHLNQKRHQYWPHTMLNTSTHDSKRSEDVRARLNVLSEIPEEWQRRVTGWREMNQHWKTRTSGGPAPSVNDEYAFYQNLLGVWPLDGITSETIESFSIRLENYMLKAAREAKNHTSWTNHNQEYEEALTHFVRSVMVDLQGPFMQSFVPFQEKIAWFGMFNSLAQLLLKLTVPGIPDIYQGNEIFHFCLVDPDNRRQIDFGARGNLLADLKTVFQATDSEKAELVKKMLDSPSDGRCKLYTTTMALALREEHRDLFAQGVYHPLATQGKHQDHICAFVRRHGSMQIIVAVPRLFAGLMQFRPELPLGQEVWHDTDVLLPEDLANQSFVNIFTGEEVAPETAGSKANSIAAATLFSSWPVTLLKVKDKPD